MFTRICVCLGSLMFAAGCGEDLSADIVGYDSKTTCVRINQDPILPYDGDPHKGIKNVYVCNVELPAIKANMRPFPDGTIIVKESRREGEAFTWLIATARKEQGKWRWDEYTRNFEDEGHERLPLKQSKCTNCHDKAALQDNIFTQYDVD